jgi:hypothetical protein
MKLKVMFAFPQLCLWQIASTHQHHPVTSINLAPRIPWTMFQRKK